MRQGIRRGTAYDAPVTFMNFQPMDHFFHVKLSRNRYFAVLYPPVVKSVNHIVFDIKDPRGEIIEFE